MGFVFVIIIMFPLAIIYLIVKASSYKGNGNEKFRTNNNYFEKKQNLSDMLAGSIKKQN